jgi:predicted GIY-YIG superfamily endonuclease
VYQHRDADGAINYFGITSDLRSRASKHRNDPEKTGETMEVISEPVDHGTARTLEAKLIRERLQHARLDGVIDGTEPKREQLEKAGLLNRNRGREEARWVDGVELEDHIVDPLETHDIRTPKPR